MIDLIENDNLTHSRHHKRQMSRLSMEEIEDYVRRGDEPWIGTDKPEFPDDFKLEDIVFVTACQDRITRDARIGQRISKVSSLIKKTEYIACLYHDNGQKGYVASTIPIEEKELGRTLTELPEKIVVYKREDLNVHMWKVILRDDARWFYEVPALNFMYED